MNFEKFSRTPTLLLHIAKIISTWKKVCLYPIFCSFIWFNYIRSKKRNAFNSFTNSKWNSSWFLTIYYSLGSPFGIYSDSNISACKDHFCNKNVSFYAKCCSSNANQKGMGDNIYMTCVYILYACFGIPEKSLSESYE